MSREEVTPAAAIELDDELDARETVSVAASIAAVALGVAYWVSRVGFANPPTPVITAVGVALFIIVAPLWLMRLSRRFDVGAGEWWTSQPVLTLMMLVLTGIFGMISRGAGVPLGLVLGVPGAGLFLWTLFLWLRRGRILATLAFVAGTLWFIAWAGGIVWGTRYKMPLYWERFAVDANVHHDPLYYASMANMLDVYGVPSTGIDGLAAIRYHYGSAWLFAQLAHLIGTDVLTFYSLGYAIILVPLFFAAVLLLAVETRRSMSPEAERPLRTDFRVWIVFAVAAIGLFPVKALFGIGIWNANALLSESYLTGMTVFLLVIAAAVAFYRTDGYRSLVETAGEDPESQPNELHDRSAVVFLLCFLPLVLMCLGFLKVSLMLLLLPLVLYTAYRLRIWNRGVTAMSLGICVVVTALTYPVVSLPAQNEGFTMFAFMRFHIAEGWQQFFPMFGMMWAWAYVALRLWEERIGNTRELKNAYKQRRILDVEIVFLVALLGFIPGEIVDIHGGSAIYFSDVQRWVAIAFMVARVGTWTRKWRAIREARALRLPGGWRGVQLSTIAAVFVALPFAITVVLNSVYWPIKVYRANEALRMTIATKGGGGLITDPGPLGRGLRKSDFYSIETALRRVESLPLSVRRQSALFVPQSYDRYWHMFDADERCTFVPFVAPAIAGVTMIDGMPARTCKLTDQYNFVSYTGRTRDQRPEDVSRRTLCTKAKNLNVSQVLVIAPDSSGNARLSRIPCAG